MQSDNLYMVSVRLMTYNHEQFIAEAMEGIMKQQTSFRVEVVVGDDLSQDGTLEIIRKYSSTENIHIRILERSIGDEYSIRRKELGRIYNFTNIISNCKGKYIALLDGDDYWTDPLKLQKQVDFLETYPEYVACYHSVKVVDENNSLLRRSKSSAMMNQDLSGDDLVRGRVMSVLSLCFRNVINEFPPEFYNVLLADKFLCSLLGNYGNGKFLSDIEPAAYRMHAAGVWSLTDSIAKKKGLMLSYFWLWKYYERIGKDVYANHFFYMILREGQFSVSFNTSKPGYIDRFEVWFLRNVRRIFGLIRRLIKKYSR